MMVHRVAFALGEHMEKRDDFIIPEEVAEWIGLKKSEYLSKLIERMTPNDFGFEEFHQFNHLVNGTIEEPDRTFEIEEDKQIIQTYVRTYNEAGTFHQVVQGVVLQDQKSKAKVFIPILIFVSKNVETVKFFSVGRMINRPTLN